ncbi:MAG TPA: UvrD-helicase domain-containing protein [Acidobacteriaceae bacterium]|nr:UvrD-helicase domain-containing protein [Acidobacteriaceae bacterium]
MPEVMVAPVDAAQRERALDIRRSVIVQAPAGSGKTDLLTRRFLRLLAVVDEPEQILAITFTRAATAEMRSRILSDLESAAGRGTSIIEDQTRLQLARAALAQSERRGWDILNHPHRLAIETIDSLCLRIARERPLLAALGGQMQPTEEAEPLHALAAHRTLAQLGGNNAELNAALAHFLDLRDNKLPDCESLLAKMLAQREQWQHILPLSRAMSEDDWDIARERLQAPFRHEVKRVLDEAYRVFSGHAAVAQQLLELANYALDSGNERLRSIVGTFQLSAAMSPEHWICVHDLVIRDGQWRRTVDKRHGFPSRTAEEKRRRNAMIALLGWLQSRPDLLSVLCAIKDLPPAAYTDDQWTTLRHMLTVLRQAIGELAVVFAERNAVDFTQLNLAALHVLRQSPDLSGSIGAATHHLLIDEFQDTSQLQLEIVQALIAAWDLSEHRTCFLVGDPMQSIYMFRQAEVEIFSDVRDRGIGPHDNRIACNPVQLSVNFRSHSGLTTPLNDFFARIAAVPAPPGSAAVDFAPATSADAERREPSVHVHPQIIGDGEGQPSLEDCRLARDAEAREVLRILERHLPLIAQAQQRGGEYRVAVLVRARPHLLELVPLLRKNGIPFRAVEIEHLSERQELLDLRSLTRALLHPADRIAWLSVLRAPWCGLTLADLHTLTGSDDPNFAKRTVPELIESRQLLLSADGQERLARTWAILRSARDARWTHPGSFASWIERTWSALGGPFCLDTAALENTRAFFSLLDGVAPDGLRLMTQEFSAEMDRLFAQPDPQVSERCGIQLMTIHRAKGLGFEVVIVPGLDRKSSSDSQPLLCSLERRNPWTPGEEEFLVAPIGPKGDDSEPLYQWVTKQRNMRFDEERKRLLYVACTRARRELHLLGTAILSGEELRPGEKSSLLETAWPALREQFENFLDARRRRRPVQKILAFPEPGDLSEMAASEGVHAGPKRLPRNFEPSPAARNIIASPPQISAPAREFERPEGTRRARVIGSAVHAMLQRLGPELASLRIEDLRIRAASLLRGFGLSGESHAAATQAVLSILSACAADPVCQWILAAHPEAQSEASWSGFAAGSRLQTLRADRVFRAGAQPLASGSDCFWIIDYKTGAPASADRQQWLAHQRQTYASQLAAYGRALRALHGAAVPLRLGLYYPALAAPDSAPNSALDWWDPDRP